MIPKPAHLLYADDKARSRIGWEGSRRKARDESRPVRQYAVPRRLRCRRPHPGDGGAGAGGARCRVRLAVVPASLADPPDADAADHPGNGLRRGARAGHDDRAEHPDPAAAQSGACRRGSRHPRRPDGRQLHPRRRARLSPAGVRGVRRSARRARAALHRSGRLDAPAVERGAGQPQGPILYRQ